MKRFARLYRELDGTTRTNEKVRALARYFADAPAADAAWAVWLLTGQRGRRTVTSRSMRGHFQRRSDLPEWLVELCRAHVGDSAETITLLITAGRRSSTGSRGRASGAPAAPADDQPPDLPPDLPLHVWLEDEIPALGALEEDAVADALWRWWRCVPAEQLFVLNKVLTGAFRVGVSRKLVTRGLAQAFEADEPSITHRLMGTFEPSADAFRSLVAGGDGDLPPSHPYPFMLAYPLDDPAALGADAGLWLAEWKLDGIRGQLVRRAGGAYLWSRGEELVTDQFPELAEAAAAFPDGTVLDGEIAAWDLAADAVLPFNLLQPRLGRKRVGAKLRTSNPVAFVAYDLLEDDGEDIRKQPLEERVSRLDALLGAVAEASADASLRFRPSRRLSFASADELEALRETAREANAEGLMVKKRDSPYLAGRVKGSWWKHKVEPFTLDAVLLYAQAGTGRRANLFTDYTFALWSGNELVPFAKAYSGLSDVEIAELDRWIRRNTVERFGPARTVAPEQVFEIAFEGIRRSKRHKSGLAVRFPRIARWRKDKPVAEADTLEAAENILLAVLP